MRIRVEVDARGRMLAPEGITVKVEVDDGGDADLMAVEAAQRAAAETGERLIAALDEYRTGQPGDSEAPTLVHEAA